MLPLLLSSDHKEVKELEEVEEVKEVEEDNGDMWGMVMGVLVKWSGLDSSLSLFTSHSPSSLFKIILLVLACGALFLERITSMPKANWFLTSSSPLRLSFKPSVSVNMLLAVLLFESPSSNN